MRSKPSNKLIVVICLLGIVASMLRVVLWHDWMHSPWRIVASTLILVAVVLMRFGPGKLRL